MLSLQLYEYYLMYERKSLRRYAGASLPCTAMKQQSVTQTFDKVTHKEKIFEVSFSWIKQSPEVCEYKADQVISIRQVDSSKSIPRQVCQDIPALRKQQEHRA